MLQTSDAIAITLCCIVVAGCQEKPPPTIDCRRYNYVVTITGYGDSPEKAMHAAREAANGEFPDRPTERPWSPSMYHLWRLEPTCQPQPEPLLPSEIRKIRSKLQTDLK